MNAYRFGRFRLEPALRRVTDETGSVLPLHGRAFDVLEYLVRNRDRVVGKDELLSAVWAHVIVDENNLNQAISAIRRALHDSREAPEFVETMPGRGYRFIAATNEEAPNAPGLLPVDSVTAAEPREPRSSFARQTRPHTYVYVVAGLAALLIAGLSVDRLRREPVSRSSAHTEDAPRAPPTVAVLPFRAPAENESSDVLARSVTDIIRNRLAAFKDLRVVAGTSVSGLADTDLDIRDVGRGLHAQFLLQGSVQRDGDRLTSNVQLLDMASGSELWSSKFDQSVTTLAELREEVATRVADSLHIGLVRDPKAAAAEINLDAYQLYIQGQELISNQTVSDTTKAIALFRRATILDPAFARGYLALGQALLLTRRFERIAGTLTSSRIGNPERASPERMPDTLVLDEAQRAIERSLQLDPQLGEAWVERADLDNDPVRAEELYRKGLALAPNYGVGYMRFSEFLYAQYRKGEAMEMIDRARQIDPLTPSLHVSQAFMLMVTRSDVVGHDRLLNEALAIKPQFVPALTQLARSRHEYSGEFADAVRVIEQAIAVDPGSEPNRFWGARIYLDVDDPAAAIHMLSESRQPTEGMVEVAQYQRDIRQAAALAKSGKVPRWRTGPIAPMAEAIRDEAIATGDFTSALKIIEAEFAKGSPGGVSPRMWSRGIGLVYAHTLLLAGDPKRSRDLVTTLLVEIDGESVGRTADWFSRDRATAFAILGEDERALQELTASAKTNKFYRWWYLADLDPVYERMRSDPRFQALAEQANAHRRSQRAVVDELRRKGEVPKRTS